MFSFDEQLRARITTNLAGHERRIQPLEGLRHAAVAIVLVDSEPNDDNDPFPVSNDQMAHVPGDVDGLDGRVFGVSGGAAFLLCRRAAKMNRHAGQWALPGGGVDPGETTTGAALRELREELGLELTSDSVLGFLDDYTTRSGFVMTPVVIWGGTNPVIIPEPSEVAHVYRIGLQELCRADSPRFVTIPESERPVVQIPLSGDLIHAPTGAVLLQFRWVALEGLLGKRVDHLEQPIFAWM